MVIEVPEKFEAALKLKAEMYGVSTDAYVEELFEKDLAALLNAPEPRRPVKTAFGSFAHFGPAPKAEEIDENRKDMFRNFGEKW